MNKSSRTTLMGLVAVLAIGAMFMQSMLDPQIREIHKGEKTALAGLSNEFILGPMLGLQQAVAGALWVRADEFFHEGDYDAILPIVRMVTWLDPHQLDVYITGAWHLSYNFTDSSERSDRRYIPAAQKLLEEGAENNATLYDIPFELGWENVDKIKNYDRAEIWFRKSTELKSSDPSTGPDPVPAPMFTWHQLAHALERQGRVLECVDVWRKALAMSEEKLKEKKDDWQIKNVRDSEKHNLELTLQRYFSRYIHQVDFDLSKKYTKSINEKTGEPSPNQSFLASTPKEGIVGQPRDPATKKPWNTSFESVIDGKTTVLFPKAKVMDIKGVFNIGDGARVTVRLHDADWHEPTLKDFTFDIDQSQTIMQDQLSVRSKTWGRKIDMSKDPKMYSFSRDKEGYYLVLEFNPRGTSPFIQDKFGWSGEGMTDPKYLWTEKSNKPGIKPDLRMIRKVYHLNQAQIMGNEPVTENDVITAAEYDQVQQKLQQKATEAGQP